MNYLLKEETITDIADAIREKTATADEYSPLEMPDAIRSIQGGGVDASIVDNPDGGVDVTIGGETRTLATQDDLSTLGISVVKTVNGIGPDESGNVEVQSGIVYTAGDNVQISEDNVISATDTQYTAGTNITIDENNVISATMDKYATIEYVDSLMGRVNRWLGSGVIR